MKPTRRTATANLVPALVAIAAAISLLGPPNAQAGEATKGVVKALEARDCAAAAKELNTAIAGGSAEALVFGGVMFEEGLCLKANGERAARLYQRAADAGAPDARSRLASLYASPVGGSDKGAAIWWGLQAGLPLPKACVVDADMRGNAERFAQTLNAWPAGQVDACVHVTAVLAVLDAELVLLKPDNPSQDGVTVEFRPATGRLAASVSALGTSFADAAPRVTTANNVVGSNAISQSASPEQIRAQAVLEEKQELARQIDRVCKSALARFPRSASAIDADWRTSLRVAAVRVR